MITVRTEVVREFLIDGLFDAVASYADGVPAELGPAMEAAVDTLGLAAGAPDLAARVCRAGYLARRVEVERFPRAREPLPELTAMLRERGALDDGGRMAAVTSLSAELARREPSEKPHPDDEHAMSWRVPGPGGHVRHYLALHALQAELGDGAVATQPAVIADLKRAWMYGFYLRCCEESLPAGPPAPA